MIHPNYFNHKAFKTANYNILDSQLFIYINSKIAFSRKILEIEKTYVKNIVKRLANTYARLKKTKKLFINHCFQQELINTLKIINY